MFRSISNRVATSIRLITQMRLKLEQRFDHPLLVTLNEIQHAHAHFTPLLLGNENVLAKHQPPDDCGE